jgi:hypothetical protein
MRQVLQKLESKCARVDGEVTTLRAEMESAALLQKGTEHERDDALRRMQVRFVVIHLPCSEHACR